MNTRNTRLKRRISEMTSVKSVVLFLLLALTLSVVVGCQGEASAPAGSSVEQPSGAVDSGSGESGESSGESSEDSDDGEHSGDDDGASQSSEGEGQGQDDEDEDTDTVSMQNPNPDGAGPTLNRTANKALANTQPLDIITWTAPPTIAPGELSGEGTAEGGAYLFNPQFEDADGAAFEVYYEGHEEPMVVLLPDLGPMEIWNTFETVATMDWEMEGGKFSFRAYSPLFMDADPSALELRVYGYDGDGDAALLAVTPLTGE